MKKIEKIEKVIGINVRRAREGKALTVDQLADMAEVSRQTIYNVEGGKQPKLRAATVAQLASALGVTPNDLMAGEITEEAAKALSFFHAAQDMLTRSQPSPVKEKKVSSLRRK